MLIQWALSSSQSDIGFLHTSSAPGFPGLLVADRAVWGWCEWSLYGLGNPDGSTGACRAGEIAFSRCFKPWLIEPRAWSQTAFCCILIWSQFQSLPKLKIQNVSACASRSRIVCTHLENTWVSCWDCSVWWRTTGFMERLCCVQCLPDVGLPTVCF